MTTLVERVPPATQAGRVEISQVERPPRDWLPDSAVELCTELLRDLPDRLRHSLLCGRHAELLAGAVPVADRNLLVAAAYLHDIGYSAVVVQSGFHPLDGARFLRQLGAPPRLAALVAHHSEARMLARANGLLPALAEFRRERSLVSDALTYADMTAGPNGIRMSLEDRLADTARRHTNDGPRLRAARSSRVPNLLAAVERIRRELTPSPIPIDREALMSTTLVPRESDTQSAALPARRGYATRTSPVGTVGDRAAFGKQQRHTVGLADHGVVVAGPGRRSPIDLLEEQAVDRVPELVPIRYGRMLVSPFTCYRGAARVMAADLSVLPRTNLTVQLCGDAHLSNFGLYASPERRLMFDLNDFDETLPGPFEWDVKRLMASLVVAARENGIKSKDRRAMVAAATARYRTAMAAFAGMREIDIWYSSLDAVKVQRELAPKLDAKRQKKLQKVISQAQSRDSTQAQNKLTEVLPDGRRLVADPPLIVPVRDLYDGAAELLHEECFTTLIRQYRRSLPYVSRALLDRYHFVDMARKVVGLASAGTRCWIVLMPGRNDDDPLLLQIKEAAPSVLSEFLGRSQHPNNGQRVVTGQQLMQATSDIFLGWQRTAGLDDVERDFYFRQLRDWKGSFDIGALRPEGLLYYGEQCAWCLARGHARSGDAIAISAYLGNSTRFDQAMAEFAENYADLNEADDGTLVAPAAARTIKSHSGL